MSQFLRLCALFGMAPGPMLGEFGVQGGPVVPLAAHDEYGHTQVAAYLLERCGELSVNEDAIGWTAEGLEGWLSDDCALGLMRMQALKDVCEFAGVGLASVLSLAWGALGR